jgi:uncharacterized protein (TIGR02246 family)
MKLVKIISMVVTTLLVACSSESKIDTAAEGEKIMQLSREWSTVAATNDVEKILSYWADDAVLMFPGAPEVRGKENIRIMVEANAKMPGFAVSWEPLEAHVSDDGKMAYLFERNKMTMTDSLGNTRTSFSRGISVWRNIDGQWKNVAETGGEDSGRKE